MPRSDDGLPEKLGKSINELDIDFSQFTLAGWVVSLLSLAAGGMCTYATYWYLLPRVHDHRGPALGAGLAMIAVTVIVFKLLRRVFAFMGISCTRGA